MAFGGIAGEERLRHPGRVTPARRRRATWPALAAARGPGRAGQPAARRPAGRPGRAVATRRPGHRHRADARPGPHPGRRGPATTARSSTATAPATTTLRALPDRRGRRRGQGRGVGRGHLRHRRRRRSATLARRMAAARTLVTVTWSLQRAQHGEQPVWAGHRAGRHARPDRAARRRLRPRLRLDGRHRRPTAPTLRLPRLPQGVNPVATFIPVARIADMLLHPGESLRLRRRSG